jgi:hypothetical protein
VEEIVSSTALHVIAITRARIDPQTRAYLDRKRAEGKTNREALRCLKRPSHGTSTDSYQCPLTITIAGHGSS